ncbi:unnamed protein product [Ectocarpus sp. 12 AP-2014]
MASYSHARQVEVVASLDTAEAEAGAGTSDTHRQDDDDDEAAAPAATGVEEGSGGSGEDAGSKTADGDAHKVALSAIASGTEMEPGLERRHNTDRCPEADFGDCRTSGLLRRKQLRAM